MEWVNSLPVAKNTKKTKIKTTNKSITNDDDGVHSFRFKANVIDELSLILVIENEITRYHGAHTMKEAIDFWQEVCRENPLLKQWLERDGSCSSTGESIKITHEMLSAYNATVW